MNLHQMLNKYRGFQEDSDLGMIVDKNGETKGVFYDRVVKEYETYWTESIDWYRKLYQRHYQKMAGRHRPFFVSSESPCIIGQGQQTVLETGMALHKTYGVPYIPGTALKGLAAHYCHRYLGAEHPSFRMDGDSYKVLFGTQQEAGYIRFFDALPTPETVRTALLPDVMTPHHHQSYNSLSSDASKRLRPEAEYAPVESGANAPRDDDSPIPVPFLSVVADFRIMLFCESDSEEADAWLEIAEQLVLRALKLEGIGGKTNAGYGRMTLKQARLKDEQRKQQ
ncbi:MAG: type III-B CRISPR module RAMP protein Cmr6 [Paenibacillus macerans]|uniref:type III-B CRISPR module RAMP protein Cmr6 n=1 Tax=Paenibacillus macerans TaxID=44252 RepID=UPI00242DFC71|nr:type III-B CRISPR module RAMP protein Cmr6 [Paenibacillus macerans]MBS5910519.1 type III-B CRISPR module RAMP protein Cmr6 [Paenibacillus macerans]